MFYDSPFRGPHLPVALHTTYKLQLELRNLTPNSRLYEREADMLCYYGLEEQSN
jgi:hypothetical protein